VFRWIRNVGDVIGKRLKNRQRPLLYRDHLLHRVSTFIPHRSPNLIIPHLLFFFQLLKGLLKVVTLRNI